MNEHIAWLPRPYTLPDGTSILPGWVDVRMYPIPLECLDLSKRYGAER